MGQLRQQHAANQAWVQTIPLTKRVFPAAALLATVLLSGCTPASVNDDTAHLLPTPCEKSLGVFYDPKTKSCVHPTGQHEVLVLNAYSYASELAQTTTELTHYSLYPRNYLTEEEADSLWSDLRAHGAHMERVSAVLPDLANYDSSALPDGTTPRASDNKVWGGGDAALTLAWTPQLGPSDATIEGMFLQVDAAMQEARARPELHKAIVFDHDYRVVALDVLVSPAAALDFWDRHVQDIEGMQPIVTSLDRLTPELGPMQPRTEGQ